MPYQPEVTPFVMQGISFGQTKIGTVTLEGKIGTADNNYLLEYFSLLKEARTWASQGQTRLSMEAERRAKCLLNGNVNEYKKQIHSEHLFVRTNKFKYLNVYYNR